MEFIDNFAHLMELEVPKYLLSFPYRMRLVREKSCNYKYSIISIIQISLQKIKRSNYSKSDSVLLHRFSGRFYFLHRNRTSLTLFLFSCSLCTINSVTYYGMVLSNLYYWGKYNLSTLWLTSAHLIQGKYIQGNCQKFNNRLVIRPPNSHFFDLFCYY